MFFSRAILNKYGEREREIEREGERERERERDMLEVTGKNETSITFLSLSRFRGHHSRRDKKYVITTVGK